MSAFGLGATGVSPAFAISAEDFLLHYLQAVTKVPIDGVPSPTLGANGGTTAAFNLINFWSPWIDEKLVDVKFDGVCKFLGVASNRPTMVKDYHTITLMRATDYILIPQYIGVILGTAGTVLPLAPAVP